MVVQYASDLHLDFQANRRYIMNCGIEPVGDCLVLAGDIANLFQLNLYADFWKWCSKNFALTVMVPGNHDCYGDWSSREKLIQPMKKKILPNVLCCNNTVLHLGKIDIVCSTLWSEIKSEFSMAVANGLLDFRAISIDSSPVTLNDYLWVHEESLRFVKNVVQTSSAKQIVVVTHHLPSYAVLADVFKESPLNSGFVTELGNWIVDSPIDFWIYGHSHISIERRIGTTRLLSNQLGYVGYGEGDGYQPDKHFVVCD